MPRIVSAAEAVKAIPDDAVVAVNSSSGLNCPDAVLKALGERYDSEAHPRNLTMLHPIAAGDMFGIRGVERNGQQKNEGNKCRDAESSHGHISPSCRFTDCHQDHYVGCGGRRN